MVGMPGQNDSHLARGRQLRQGGFARLAHFPVEIVHLLKARAHGLFQFGQGNARKEGNVAHAPGKHLSVQRQKLMDKSYTAPLKSADIARQQLRIADDHRTVEGAGI